MWNDERHFLLFFSEINGYMSVFGLAGLQRLYLSASEKRADSIG